MDGWERRDGSAFPLGANWVADESAWNFAIYSKHAERVTLLLFLDSDVVEPIVRYDFDHLRNKSGPIWHCRLPVAECGDASYYAFQIDGPPPGAGFAGHHFDREKHLLDPYARDVYFPPGFSRQSARRPGSNAGEAPLGVLRPRACHIDWQDDRPVRHDADLIVYEMHVKGFTRRENSGVAASKRGTFAGVVEKIPYLKELGVTAVELMPVFQFDPDDGNYWGYMPLSLFAPHSGYCVYPERCLQHVEFAEMVRELHAAGIEVILDVVYNHTCEGDESGPIYSFKGIDNSTYYMLTGDRHRPFANFSGTGNTLHTANRAVRQLIIDSLRYWVTDMHVDGFRFDLASVFTRDSDGSISTDDPPIFGQIGSAPELSAIRLIAEPWDAGAFQLGRRFPGTQWLQWNSDYRDGLQKFVRGDRGMVPDLMTRLYGSSDLFPDDRMHALRPWQSVNYITSHDGFTLYDLVSYERRRNDANGHNNTDGHSDFSWNCGWEGDVDVPAAVLDLRRQQAKNLFCLLMLSNGTPMFRMGDEFLQSQNGNNNPYNQDNETSWLDWARLAEHAEVFRFFRCMIAFRKSHPSLCRNGFWRGDISWYGVDHDPDLSQDSHALAFCLHGASVGDADIYVLANASSHALQFGIHEGQLGEWTRVVDTSRSAPEDIFERDAGVRVDASFYAAAPRSVVVLVRGTRGPHAEQC